MNLLSCNELCACDILEHFDFSQPTLSHHMKVLETANIIVSEIRGKWHYYSLNEAFADQFTSQIEEIVLHNGEYCICQQKPQVIETNTNALENNQ